MLTRDQKRQQSEELRGILTEVSTLFLMENTGLNVNEVNQLRSQVRKSEASYKVVKNSVVKLAVEGTELEGLTPFLVGPKALAYTEGDGVALAKVLRDFVKEHPALSFQRAYLEGQILEADEAAKIAEMPSKEELLTKLVFLLQSPIRRLAVALNAPVQNLASVLGQVAQKQEDGGSAAAGDADATPGDEATEAATTDEPAEEEPSAEATGEAAEAPAEATTDDETNEAAEATGGDATEDATEDAAEATGEAAGDENNEETKES